jgi:hypothetical protein
LALSVSLTLYEPAPKPDGSFATTDVLLNEAIVKAALANHTFGGSPVWLKPVPLIVS